MILSRKIKLSPTKEQKIIINQMLHATKFIYNKTLFEVSLAWRVDGTKPIHHQRCAINGVSKGIFGLITRGINGQSADHQISPLPLSAAAITVPEAYSCDAMAWGLEPSVV